jgi:DNA-binding MarR family transcriptional regulator
MPKRSKPTSGVVAPSPALPDLGCACATIRRAARLVTQVYSQEMGWNVEPSQFSLLMALSRLPESPQAPLCRALGLDKTTLSRNLALMHRNGWLEPAESKGDRRDRGYRLTAAGKEVLEKTLPGWQRAQAKLRAALEPGHWDEMMKMLGQVARVANELQDTDETTK